MPRLPVAVVGAGLAGLTAARTLRERGIPVRVFEASPRMVGLAETFEDEDGFKYDFGAHFITNRLAAAVGVASECRLVRRYGESVHLRGRSYAYPFGLLASPHFLGDAAGARLRGWRGSEPAASAADWFRAAYGRALADEVAIPLLEAWSGAPADQLAPAVADKIPSSIAETIFLKVAARVTRRAVAIGYCRELPQSASVWHVYPNGGVAAICRKLAEGLEGDVQTEARVDRILVEDGAARAVVVAGREVAVSAVVSTAPVNVLARLVAGSDALAPLARFRYRPMLFVNLRMRGRGLLPDVVTWTPEAGFPFFRLTEASQSMPWLAPPDTTMVTADIGCEVDDAMWSRSDEELVELCVEQLVPLIPDAPARSLGGRVLRTRIAYPIFLRAYEEDRQRFSSASGIQGLVSVGRNGEFDHLLMEDVHTRTVHRADRLADELEAGSA